MRPRTALVLILVFLVLLFAALNWRAFTYPTRLSVLFGEVTAPLGVVMLAVLAVLGLVFLALLLRIEAAAAAESRRTLKELEKARRLAEREEESRFHQLQQGLELELEQLHRRFDALLEHLGAPDAAQRVREDLADAPGEHPPGGDERS